MEKGGAISYSLYRPTLNNNTFTNNSASYGNDLGSYAVKIKIKGSNTDEIQMDNIGSGLVYDNPFTLAIYDLDGQIVNLDSTSQISITGNSTSSSTKGINAVKLTNGEATFSSIIFISIPGSQNILFNIASAALNSQKVKLLFGQSYEQNKLVGNFRF